MGFESLEDGVDALNLQEKEDELFERYMFPAEKLMGVENKDSIFKMINNHSSLVMTKE